MSENNPFKKLEAYPPDSGEKKLKPEIRALIWQRTRSNLGVVEMLLNVMDLFFVKAGATITQSFGSPNNDSTENDEPPENSHKLPK